MIIVIKIIRKISRVGQGEENVWFLVVVAGNFDMASCPSVSNEFLIFLPALYTGSLHFQADGLA